MDPGVLLWFDVETTGLDPKRDLLLEVGAVVTTFDGEMQQTSVSFEMAVHRSDDELAAVPISDHVREMHAKSGLWADVQRSPYREHEMWVAFGRWWAEYVASAENIYLAGRSVHFDRKWLERVATINGLSHRHFDLTPIKAYAAQIGIVVPEGEDAHRALPDVLADVELARELVARGRVGVDA